MSFPGTLPGARPSSGPAILAAAVVAVLLAVLLIGCGSARRSEPILGALPDGAQEHAQGRLVFARKCDACHVGGEGGLGPALNDKPLPKLAMKLQVRRGLGSMPAFSEEEIGDRELDLLLEYVVSLR